MADETQGQLSEGTPSETTGAGTEGQTAEAQTTDTGTAAEETFFDPSTIKGTPLEGQYKEMQRAFTKKTTERSQWFESNKAKVDAYDNFMANPRAAIESLASQYGFSISQSQTNPQNGNSWEPKSWDDVMSRARAEAREDILKDLGPVIQEVHQIKRNGVERTLDEYCSENNLPDWRMHEDSMKSLLGNHPTLVKDPVLLYEMSLPKNVRESRATQQAMKKLENRVKGATVSSGSNTNRAGDSVPQKGLSFQQAVEVAKAKLAEQGIGPNH